jgi:sulfate permease, SulP family
MRVDEMRQFYRLAPREFWLAVVTLVSVVVFDVLPALGDRDHPSLVLLIARASKPKVSILGADPEMPGLYLDLRRHSEFRPIEGVLILRPNALCSTRMRKRSGTPSTTR